MSHDIHEAANSLPIPARTKMWLYIMAIILVPFDHFWPKDYNWCDVVLFILKAVSIFFIILRTVKKIKQDGKPKRPL